MPPPAPDTLLGSTDGTDPVPEFSRARFDQLVDLAERVLADDGLRAAVILGDRGLGKSRALATIEARVAGVGQRTVRLDTGREARDVGSFGSLLAGFPDLGSVLDRHRLRGDAAGSDLDPASLEPLMAALLADADDRLLLLVDDAERLDPATAQVLDLLQRDPDATAIRLVLTGRQISWLPGSETLFKSQRTHYLTLEHLNRTDIAGLVGELFREASAPTRTSLTTELLERSEGHPAVLDALLPLIDRRTLTLDESPTPTAGAVELAIVDARADAITGAYRRAVQKLSALDRIPGLKLNRATRRLLATSLYRIGAITEADRLGADLVREALAAGDHTEALEAATIGLPEAEGAEGNPARVQALLAIDPAKLSPASRFRHAAATARQAMLVNRTELARSWADAAREIARSPEDRASVAHVDWYLSTPTMRPEHQIEALRPLAEDPDLSPGWQAIINELQIINHYEAGRIDIAEDLIDAIGDQAEEVGNDMLAWHHLSFRNMLAFDRGEWPEANLHRVDAMVHARERAIADGEHLFLAQTFNEAWIKNEHANFLTMFSQVAPEIGQSRMGRTAYAESLRAAGRLDEARRIGEPLLADALDPIGPRSLPILSYLARLIGELGDDELIERASETLTPRAGSMLVVGAGITSFGPVDRYLFQLTGDQTHLDRAIEVADRAAVPLWQVLLRTERAAVPGTPAKLLLRQAERIAEGTALGSLL
ncbi:MAG: hypothetical protein AAF547_12975 [Actinomycetota bacterium]